MIPNDATAAQIEAADPRQSTWLSANAGSGKTRVLTDRVARLLLSGTRPENILCLTYTKAAASEMQNRLFKRLGAWAMMPETDLRAQLRELGSFEAFDPRYLANARTLFAAAIETPGGLKIQTIHSFCASILRRFPLEAGVSPQFKEMEDRTAQLLREEVLEELALEENTQSFERFASYFTGDVLSELLGALTARRDAFLSPTDEQKFLEALDLPVGATEEDALRIAFQGGEKELVCDLADAAQAAPKTYQTLADNLGALNLSAPSQHDLAICFKLLLYSDRTSKSRNWPQSNHTKAVEVLAHLTDDMHAWMDRTKDAFDHLNKLKALQRTKALHAFAKDFVQAYETKKSQRGMLDFDDLIRKAKALLNDPVVAQWVLFRLDGGVDHVLVDEAQDTSPDQWDIIQLLTQEFSTGEGARPERERTIFVVGDKKQSIYSFQGADPKGFDRMNEHFKSELALVNRPLQKRQLRYSFRSAQEILRLVDEVFQGENGVGLEDNIEHLAFKDAMPGRVDWWPAVEKPEKQEEREWDDPLDQKGDTNHVVILARRVASEIRRMIKEEFLPVEKDKIWKKRRITEGDFLILVQRRSDLFHEIISACKEQGLNIAGADRLKLGGELAVKDLTALLSFLALPEDDLSLAAALKSPLFGWSEQELYTLAHHRQDGQGLWEALRKASEKHPRTMEILNDLRRQSDFLRPYDLINRVLIRHDGRRMLLARLGQEAEDGIDALLSQALGYEQSDVPSLTGFLSWLVTEDVQVKRQMDSAGDRIRVMTVHGAKGLEAPIVILPDTAKRNRQVRGQLLSDAGTVWWRPKANEMPDALANLKESMLEADDEERRRLLYVAMTRAEQWLVVAATGDVGDDDNDSWHSTIGAAMDHVGASEETTEFGPIKRFSLHNWGTGDIVETETSSKSEPLSVPFGDVLPNIAAPPEAVSPSKLGGAKVVQGEGEADESEEALARGRVIHDLLEALIHVSPEDRSNVAKGVIENHPDVGLLQDPDGIFQEVERLLQDQNIGELIRTGLAEVPISAELASLGGKRMFGIIDLLIVTPDQVTAFDYKSNRIVPTIADDVPLGLLRQMALYRDALRLVYPDRPIKTALIWTKSATVTALPDDLLDHSLIGVTGP